MTRLFRPSTTIRVQRLFVERLQRLRMTEHTFMLGILSAFVALGFITILYKTEDLFENLRIPNLLKRDSIYTFKLSRRGINLFQGQEVNVLRSLQVSIVMKTDFEQIRVDTPLRKLMDGQVLSEIEVPGTFIGKTLQELNLRSRFGTEVVLIKQNFNSDKNEKQYVMMPQPDCHFKFGDSILIMCSQDSLNKIEKIG